MNFRIMIWSDLYGNIKQLSKIDGYGNNESVTNTNDPITVATESYRIKEIIYQYLTETADDPDAEIGFKLHDFGSRGVSSQESAMIGGAAHLVNFLGSDTIAGIWMANKYYNEKMSGFSIPASEHSTMTMWGKENEVEAYRNMIKQYGDGAIFACVSDSYDIYNAAKNLWGEKLKTEVEEMNAMLVVRPDSGDPVQVAVNLAIVLETKFGTTKNSKGFKVLNNVRVIQGDGINREDVAKILASAKEVGFSATNFAFGMGGALLQKLNRDTHEFGFKNSWALVDGKEVDVYKQPITSDMKVSKKGKLDLIDTGTGVRTVKYEEGKGNSLLKAFYDKGSFVWEQDFKSIRENTKKEIYQDRSWRDKEI